MGESQSQKVPNWSSFGEQSTLRQCNSETPSVVMLTMGCGDVNLGARHTVAYHIC